MFLQPHEKRAVRFVIPPGELAYWSTAKHGWIQDVSTFDFWVGEDSTASTGGSFGVTP